jgi:hypothetical protein
VTTALCAVGYQAVAGTAGYRCSHVPLTDAAGYPINNASPSVRVEPALAIGSWVGGLECEKRACPTLCGTALGPFITGDSSMTVQRPPPEGLSDTCLSGEYGDERQIQCTKGYRPAKSPGCPPNAANCPETPMVCQIDPDDATATDQSPPVWAGASCSAMQCYQMIVANEGGANIPPAQGSVGDAYRYDGGSGCALGFFQVGALACQTNLFYQGGGCSDRFVSTMTDSAFTTGLVTGSSNNNLHFKGYLFSPH